MLVKTSQNLFFFLPAWNLSASERSVFSECPTPPPPAPKLFIKTELNIQRLLAVRLTSCDRVCCELKLIKLLLHTDLNYTHASDCPILS